MRESERVVLAVPYIKPNYANWILQLAAQVEWVDFTCLAPEDLARKAENLDALILTGGGDIQPRLYGKPELEIHCSGVDPVRDALEWRLAEIAFSLKLPVFGICRGLQLLNVAHGGTLFADIAIGHGSELPHKGKEDITHGVSWTEDSFLNRFGRSGEVNSAHHQAVDVLASGFVVAARGPDGIIEAIEYTGDAGMVCQAVQWHPERMDPGNPLSVAMGRLFLEKALASRRK